MLAPLLFQRTNYPARTTRRSTRTMLNEPSSTRICFHSFDFKVEIPPPCSSLQGDHPILRARVFLVKNNATTAFHRLFFVILFLFIFRVSRVKRRHTRTPKSARFFFIIPLIPLSALVSCLVSVFSLRCCCFHWCATKTLHQLIIVFSSLCFFGVPIFRHFCYRSD